MEENPMIKVSEKYDTGKKWVDASGVSWRIFRKLFRLGALPNNTTKATAHGETVDPAKYTVVKSFWAGNGTTVKGRPTDVQVTVDATNINLITGTDLTAYTSCEVELEWAA